MHVMIEMSEDARKEAVRAIKRELAFLEDNVYRYRHMGGYGDDTPEVRSHDQGIAHLKEALAAMGERTN